MKFYQIYQDLELEGKIISARAIVNRYQGKDETFKTLYNVFKEHNDNCRKLIGTDYADITVKRYDNCLKYLMELVRRDYKVDDMLLREVNGELVYILFVMFLSDKVCQSIKKLGQFARLSLYHVLMLLVTVAYLDIEQPFKPFGQVHPIGRLSVLIYDAFGEEQTAYHFHNIDKGCFVNEKKRGKELLISTLL